MLYFIFSSALLLLYLAENENFNAYESEVFSKCFFYGNKGSEVKRKYISQQNYIKKTLYLTFVQWKIYTKCVYELLASFVFS